MASENTIPDLAPEDLAEADAAAGRLREWTDAMNPDYSPPKWGGDLNGDVSAVLGVYDALRGLGEVDGQGVNVACDRIAREQSGDPSCDCEPQVAGRCGYCIAYGAADAVLRSLGGADG